MQSNRVREKKSSQREYKDMHEPITAASQTHSSGTASVKWYSSCSGNVISIPMNSDVYNVQKSRLRSAG